MTTSGIHACTHSSETLYTQCTTQTYVRTVHQMYCWALTPPTHHPHHTHSTHTPHTPHSLHTHTTHSPHSPHSLHTFTPHTHSRLLPSCLLPWTACDNVLMAFLVDHHCTDCTWREMHQSRGLQSPAQFNTKIGHTDICVYVRTYIQTYTYMCTHMHTVVVASNTPNSHVRVSDIYGKCHTCKFVRAKL